MSSKEESKVRTDIYWQQANTAYDLSSYGMGVHSYAVKLLTEGIELPDWLQESIKTRGSNYLDTPYVSSLEEKDTTQSNPHFASHVKLIQGMKQEYNGIKNKKRRYFLGGENGLHNVTNPSAPISEDEVEFYLEEAQRQKLFTLSGTVDISKAQRAFSQSFFALMFRDLNDIGIVQSNDAQTIYFERLDDKMFDGPVQKAAIYKLGAMLAVTDQFTYDAAQQGIPIHSTFRPNDPEGKSEAAWVETFGTTVPIFKNLYSEAHGIFTHSADHNDPLTQYLFEMKELPQLTG